MKSKKIISVLLILALVFICTACGNSDTNEVKTYSMSGDVDKYVQAVDTEFAYGIAKTLAYDEKYLSNELGFRTAGSDAEHAAADYLVSQMKDIGLTEVTKEAVTVDKWQFNSSSLTLTGVDKLITPASYATSGTDLDGITSEIVDLGDGFAADYEGKDVKGKILLAGIDQYNEYWIDSFLHEAKLHGAAALITYDKGGYAAIAEDAVNMQDVCAADLLPCVSISAEDGKYLAEQIKNGKNEATLKVDNVVEVGKGTSYNIVGKIKGMNSDQQIIVSGHYDVYFNGFQDDSCAIGLVLAMAKGMLDSEYVPENDIVFVCHAAEEWGASGSQNDWTTGAWRMINEVHPEWAGKTLAMFNFELPAYYDNVETAKISAVPEFASVVKNMVEGGIFGIQPEEVYQGGLSSEIQPTNTMEDGISYRFAGIPYFVNLPDQDNGWMPNRYHTKYDDKDTYSEEVMAYNLKLYGSLAMYIDKTPTLQLDLTANCDSLEEALNADVAKEAGVDIEAYAKALAELRIASEELNKEISDVNNRYEQAVTDELSEADLDKIREEGKALNKKSLEAFQYIQDKFIGLIFTSDVVVKHVGAQNNIETLNGIIEALEKGELSNEEETGAIDLAWQLNGGTEYGYYSFTKSTQNDSQKKLFDATNSGNVFWGTDKLTAFTDTGATTQALLAATQDESKTDFSVEIASYKVALKEQQKLLKECIDKEIASMKELTKMI